MRWSRPSNSACMRNSAWTTPRSRSSMASAPMPLLKRRPPKDDRWQEEKPSAEPAPDERDTRLRRGSLRRFSRRRRQHRPCGEECLLRHRQGGDRGAGRRVGLGQDGDRAFHPAASPLPRGVASLRRHQVQGREPHGAAPRRPAPCPRQPDFHDFSRAYDLAQPAAHHRAADRRGAEDSPRPLQQRGTSARARPAQQGRHRGPEGPPQFLPAPALRRPAPAGDDRHGARQRARPAHRRRADDGARRDHPGADPRSAAQAQIRVQHGHAADHPRSRHRAQDGGPGLRHDQWRDRRARRDARHLRFAAASLYQAPACLRAEGHAACRRSEGADHPRSQGSARVVSHQARLHAAHGRPHQGRRRHRPRGEGRADARRRRRIRARARRRSAWPCSGSCRATVRSSISATASTATT